MNRRVVKFLALVVAVSFLAAFGCEKAKPVSEEPEAPPAVEKVTPPPTPAPAVEEEKEKAVAPAEEGAKEEAPAEEETE